MILNNPETKNSVINFGSLQLHSPLSFPESISSVTRGTIFFPTLKKILSCVIPFFTFRIPINMPDFFSAESIKI